MQETVKTLNQSVQELNNLIADLHKPFSGMIEERKVLEVKCNCEK